MKKQRMTVCILLILLSNVGITRDKPNIVLFFVDDLGWNNLGYRAYEDLYASVRKGDWKLLAYRSGILELYNVSLDIKEKNDLAMVHPGKVKALTAKLIEWEKEVGVEQYSGVQ